MDVDKFTPAQLRVAAQVIDEAERQGVDANLALAVAFAESSLNQQAKNGNAIGVMQMLPAAAKDMGIDPTDHTQNLRGGIGYLKRQLDQFKDPALAVAAYHEGAGGLRSIGQGAELAEAQRQALNQYLANVQKGYPSLFGGQQRSEQAAPGQAAPTPDAQSPMDVFRTPASELLANVPQPAPDKSPMNYAAQLFGGATGAVAGAGVATTAAVPKAIQQGIQNAIHGTAGPNAPMKTGPAVPGQPSAVGNWVRSVTGREAPGGNYGEAYRNSQGIMKGKGRSYHIARPELTPQPAPTAAQRMGALASGVLGNPVMRGGLAGLGAGAQGAEAVSRYDKGDKPGAALAAAGALSSAASMVPGLQLPGAVGGALSYGGLHALDAVRRARAQTPDTTPATPQELQQAQRPAMMPWRPGTLAPAKQSTTTSPVEKISSGLMQMLEGQIPELAA